MREIVSSGRLRWTLVLALVGAVNMAGRAEAAPRVTTAVKYYPIHGQTGLALVREMDRLGPRQGFMSRAIAQTVYSLQYGADLKSVDGVCHVTRPQVTLSITYIFPQPADSLPPALARRWRQFMTGVRRHEGHHGEMAQQMAQVAERAILSTITRSDATCREMRRELKARVGAIYDGYDARQNAFDRQEHRKGGHVDRLIMALIR